METLSELREWMGIHHKPTVPEAVSPTNGQTGYTSNLLTWKSIGADYFDVYGGTDRTLVQNTRPEVRLANDTTLSEYRFLPTAIQPDTTYYWKVVALNRSTGNSTNNAAHSPVFSFTTAAATEQPVDCVLGEKTYTNDWLPTSDWSPCINGTQSREEQRPWTRSIVVPPAHGGAACGPTSGVDIQTTSRSCTITPAPGKALLKKSDLRFVGYYRYTPDLGPMDYNDGALTLRKAGGQTRLFTYGDFRDKYPLCELVVPNAPPGADWATAPVLERVKNWGVMTDRIPASINWAIGSVGWDETRNAVCWNYGDGYTPGPYDHPNQLVAVLNDTAGTLQVYGPWRTQWNHQKTLGAYTPIPAWFRPHVAGANLAVMAHMSSGAAGSPWGASLSGLGYPALTAPPDPVSDNPQTAPRSVASHGILLHDFDHRQTREDRYRVCHQPGGSTERGIPVWGSQNAGAGTNDTMQSCVWIDLPDKHGLLYFGHLATTPPGYVAPGDPDGLVHMGYTSLQNNRCSHGQDDPFFRATGPWTHMRVPHGWIYNPDDLVASATNQATLWSRTPSETFYLKDVMPWMSWRYGAGAPGCGAAFDPDTRRIYLPFRLVDFRTPAVLVLEVL